MQKIRPPWRRARTPTPAEMRASTPSRGVLHPASASLEAVGVGVKSGHSTGSFSGCIAVRASKATSGRSTSMDSDQVLGLEEKRPLRSSGSSKDSNDSNENRSGRSFLRVPLLSRRRSRSFDFLEDAAIEKPVRRDRREYPVHPHSLGSSEDHSAGPPLFGMLRRSFSRHSSTSDRGSSHCVHCLCVEEYERQGAGGKANGGLNGTSGSHAGTLEDVFFSIWDSDSDSCSSQGKEDETKATEEEEEDFEEEVESLVEPDDGYDLDDEEDEDEEDEEDNEGECGFPGATNSQSRNKKNALSTTGMKRSPSATLSQLGKSMECQQKVKPWVEQLQGGGLPGLSPSHRLTPDASALTTNLRRGRSIGCDQEFRRAEAAATAQTYVPVLRRGGSEQTAPAPLPGLSLDLTDSSTCWSTKCQISVTISPNSSSVSRAPSFVSLSPQGSSPQGAGLGQEQSPAGHSSGVASPGPNRMSRRSPTSAGTPRLERQEALTCWFDSEEPSLDLLAPPSPNDPGVVAGCCRRHISMETHPGSVETQGSFSLDQTELSFEVLPQQTSLESQTSVSMDVMVPESIRDASFDSQTSAESMGSSSVGRTHLGGSSSLRFRRWMKGRRCLSAGASPSTSPPHTTPLQLNRNSSLVVANPYFLPAVTTSGNSYGSVAHYATQHAMVCLLGSSSEYGEGEFADAIDVPPSPPAEIYLQVPVLPELAPAAGRTANTRLSPVPVAGDSMSPTCGMGVKHDSALEHRERDRSASMDASFVTLPATAAVATATRPRAAAVKGVEMSFNTTLSHEPHRKGLGCSQVVISDPQSLQQKQQAQLLRSRRHRLQRQHDASRSHDPTSSSSTTSSGPRATSSSRGSPIRPVVKKSGPVKVEEHRSSSSSSTGVEGSVGRLHLRPEKPCRSRSMEMNLSVTASSSAVATAVAAAAVVAADCEYRTLGGHARRQQWVSRLKKSGPGEVIIQNENGERRVLRSTPDWSEEAVNGDHLWVPTSASGDLCYVSDNECSKTGARMKCSACRIVAHVSCIPLVMDKMKLCRFTFWDGDLRQYREHTATLHHWVHRRSQTGKCKQCSKSFQSKLSFSNKEVIAIHCSWCKAAFHNKDTCFSMPRLSEHCSLGVNADIIVPPSWIVKLPGKDNFKSSLRKSPRKKTATRKKAKDKEKEYRAFVVKSIPSTTLKPVLVFINPKSGGNQGAKLMQKFQWLLNPRQVFDLTQGGPKAGLEMFKKVPNLRILACGGDGTAGWVLSVLDQIGISPPPAVGVLPLGTGNDLARALGWGGGYTDEPISKILRNVAEAETVYLDRWKLEVEKNADAQPTEEGKDSLPLNVMNNYFSFGVDAQIALEFHEAREARPQKFNSRLKNKMFYGQAGGKDLLQRKWKDLSEFVTLECDGKDITSKLREQKVHAILFLNIASYAGGTHPWNRAVAEQATDDGVIEVVGLTTYQLPLLQAGGHGTSLARCKIARIVTSKTIPMQVDGEACRLNPSHISISLLNRAPVLAKRRGGKSSNTARVVEQLTVTIRKICMADYEQFHYDKEQLQAASVVLGTITVSHDAVLEQVRKLIQPLLDTALGGHTTSPGPGSSSPTNGSEEKLPLDWCFIDSCTAERFFRVDSGQEHLHYISDITTDELYVLVDSGTHSCHITDSTLTDGHPSADTLTLMSGTQDLETEDSLDAAHVKLPLLDSVSGDGSQDTGLEDMLDLVRQEEEILANGDETRKARIGNEGPQGKVLKPRLSLKNMAVGVTFAISTPEENSTPDSTGQEERRQGKVGAGGKVLKARLSLKNLALGVGVAHISRGTASDENHDESTPVEEPAGSPLQHVRVGVALPGLCKISPKEQFMSTSYSRRSPLLEKPSENILKAAKTGDLKKLKDLHNSGFSLLSIDSSGSTALHLSAKNGHRDVVRYLLTATGTSARALLDMMDNDSGQTALHKAAYNRRRTIVCLLVTAGANLLLKDKEGRTPRELAIKAEDLELAEYLESQEKFQRDYSEDVTTAV